jgi:hypothetical protein
VSILSGGYGAREPAKIATAKRIATTAKPAMANEFFVSRRVKSPEKNAIVMYSKDGDHRSLTML